MKITFPFHPSYCVYQVLWKSVSYLFSSEEKGWKIARSTIWCGTERRKAKHYTAKRFIDFDGGQYILYVKQRGVFSLYFLQDKIDMNVNRKKGSASASPFPLRFSSGRSFVSSGGVYQWINEKFVCVFLICFYLFCVLCADGIFLLLRQRFSSSSNSNHHNGWSDSFSL